MILSSDHLNVPKAKTNKQTKNPQNITKQNKKPTLAKLLIHFVSNNSPTIGVTLLIRVFKIELLKVLIN